MESEKKGELNTSNPGGLESQIAPAKRLCDLIIRTKKEAHGVAKEFDISAKNIYRSKEGLIKIYNILKGINNVEKMSLHTEKAGRKTAENLTGISKIHKRIYAQFAGILGKARTWLGIIKQISREYGKIAATNRLIQSSNAAPRVVTTAPAVSSKSKNTSPVLGGPASSGGKSAGWASGAVLQMKYWLRLGIMYRAFGKLTKGMRSYVAMLETVNRAVRTSIKDVNNWNEVEAARIDIQAGAMQYLSKHLGTIEQYTEAVHQLTQAEMSRAEAIKSAPTIMALSRALDAPITESARMMVGLSELFKDKMKNMKTDSERIQHLASVVAVAVKKEVTSVKMIVKSLGYVAPIARVASMSVEELIASIAVLNTNLMQSARSGTALRQMINAIAKNSDKLNKAFNLGIDKNSTFKYIETLQKLSEKIKGGDLTVGKLGELLGGFKLRGAPAAILLAENIDKIVTRFHQLKDAKLDDLLGMRDVMEKNVPAQMKILSQNVDLTVASFLRGAIGGQSFADSLANVNSGMLPVFATAKSLGSTVSILTNKWVLMSVGLIALIRNFRKLRAVQGSWGKVFSGLSTGSYVGGGIALVTAAIYAYNRHKLAIEENIKAAGAAADKFKSEARRLGELSKSILSTTLTTEQLTAAKKNLSAEQQKNLKNITDETQKQKVLSAELLKRQKILENLSKSEYKRQADLILARSTGGSFFKSFSAESLDSKINFRDVNEKWRTDATAPAFRQSKLMYNPAAIKNELKTAAEFVKAAQASGAYSKQEIYNENLRILRREYNLLAGMNAEINTILSQPDKFSKSMVSYARKTSSDVLNYFELVSSAIRKPFAESESETKKIKNYGSEIAELRKEFEKTPDLSLADKFRAIDRADIDNLKKGQEKAKLLNSEIGNLTDRMAELKSATDGAEKFSPTLQKSVLELGKKNLEIFHKLQKERLQRENELADVRLQNEKLIAARRQKALDEYSRTIKKLESDISKYQKDSSVKNLYQLSGKAGRELITGRKTKSGLVTPRQVRNEQAVNSLRKMVIDNYLRRQISGSGYEKAMRAISDKFSPEQAARYRQALYNGTENFYQTQGQKLQGQQVRRNRLGEVVYDPKEIFNNLKKERAELYELLNGILNPEQLARLKKYGAISMISSLKSQPEREYAQQRLEKFGDVSAFERWATSSDLLTGALNRLNDTISGKTKISVANPVHVPMPISRNEARLHKTTSIRLYLNDKNIGEFAVNSAKEISITKEIAAEASETANKLLNQAKSASQMKNTYKK